MSVTVAMASPSMSSIFKSSVKYIRSAWRVISERLAKPFSLIVSSICSSSESGMDRLIMVKEHHY